MRLALDGVGVTLAGAQILEDVSVDVASGERLAVLGPSGSGKSTLLRVVAGLQPPTTGRVLLGDRDVTDVPPYRRGVGLVFQDAALFPHRDVAGNVGFGPKVAGLDEHARRLRVTEALELVGLAGAENRVVTTLSGGEAQRVALARALATRPAVLLLDEPLGSLDGPLRLRLQDDLRDLFERLSLTVVHVTHDVGEAFALGDRVAILRGGRLAQVARPEALWARPADDWVARFLGLRNVVRDGDRATVTRPEAVRVEQGQGAVVVSVDRDGPLVRLRVRRDDGAELESVTTGTEHPGPGDRVSVAVDSAGVFEVPVWRGAAPG
ncbi:MAG TPA: ABC transporter ATP-binding protein [Gaiella sp.]